MTIADYLRMHPYRRTEAVPACTRRSPTFRDYLRDHQQAFGSTWDEASLYALSCLQERHT